MRRVMMVAATVAGLVAAASVVVRAAPATAGGGCHREGRSGQTEGQGTTVEMRDNCFGPTVLRVQPGTEVTFVNRDVVAHRIDGVGWSGGKGLSGGELMTQRFSDPGIYPFTCMLHPGMSGAVVVGDGQGTGPVIEVTPPGLAASNTPAQLAADVDDDTMLATGWLITAFAVSAVLALGAFVLGRAGGRREVARTPGNGTNA
jgi:plastocyanin